MSRTEERYRGLAGREYHQGKRNVPATAYAWIARTRAAKLQRFVRPEDVVVEYGVGYGWNLAALACRRRIGFDIADAVETAATQHGIEFFSDPHKVPARSAHVVICYHTLEHLLTPPTELAHMAEWLTPGGRLVVFVPWERERRLRTYQPREANHHLYSWSTQSLGNLLDDCGLSVLEAGTTTYGYDRFAARCACRFRLGQTGFLWIRKLMQTLRPLREAFAVATPTQRSDRQIAG